MEPMMTVGRFMVSPDGNDQQTCLTHQAKQAVTSDCSAASALPFRIC